MVAGPATKPGGFLDQAFRTAFGGVIEMVQGKGYAAWFLAMAFLHPVAWLILRMWRRPTSVVMSFGLWPLTVLAGMLARRLVFDEGTATSFVIVATLFLGAGLVGWRAVWQLFARRRHAATA